MLEKHVLQVFSTVVALAYIASGQSCIRNEVLAALEEAQTKSPSSGNESTCTNLDSTLVEELNSTMKDGFQGLKEELQELRRDIKDEIKKNLQATEKLLSSILSPNSLNPGSPSNPAISCTEIYNSNSSSPSGYYWLQSSSENITRAYCDMERTCSGVQGGWMKVANINMTDPTNSCPSGLQTLTSPKRLCGMNINGGGCSSAFLNVHGVQYSQVCGKIIGYQQKSPDAFAYYNSLRNTNRAPTIDGIYVDGISLTHGQNPRKHIWTFVAALHEASYCPTCVCPCTNTQHQATVSIPPYVGNDYFCDTGSSQHFVRRFYSDDPLWDGEGCGSLNTCCSFNSPPWFVKQLPESTDDNIEMRLCADQNRWDEDIVFETLELYVQ